VKRTYREGKPMSPFDPKQKSLVASSKLAKGVGQYYPTIGLEPVE